jgi:hypothetical protein
MIIMRNEPAEVESEKTLYTHSYLHHAADFALEQAINQEDGSFLNCLCSIVMTAFCIEAYVNHVGMERLDDWNDRAAVLTKLRVVAENIGVKVDYGRRPFQSMRLANKFRNQMAHGKTVKLSKSFIQKLGTKSKAKELTAWWEKLCTVDYARQFLDDLEKVMTMIAEGYDLDIPPFGLLNFETNSKTITGR